MRLMLIALGILASGPCLACFALRPEMARDHRALVAEARSIVLLEAVASGSSCALNVVRVLKGYAEDAKSIPCRLPSEGDWMTDFSNHTETSFWDGSGRLGVEPDCRLITPAFSVGKRYLALLGIEADLKQFEQLGGEGDRWLTFVEARLREE